MQDHDPARTLIFHPGTRSVVRFGPFRFDLADGLLERDGHELRLPPRAVVILRYLVEGAGRVVSKQTLMDAAWKDAHVSETSLTEAIGLIRQALGDDPQRPEYIQTVHRRGYRFIAPILTDAPAAAARGRLHPGGAMAAAEVIEAPLAAAPRRPARARVVWVGGAAAAAIAAIVWVTRLSPAPAPVVRLNLSLAPDQAPVPSRIAHPAVAIAPDGRRIVYVGGAPGASRLFVRRLDQFQAVALSGTEGAHGPFFSPDGRWVAFFADGRLKKIPVDGGEPQVLCATVTGVGGTWLSDEAIVFAPSWTGPLMRVAASGGTPAVIASAASGYTYRWPDRLDDRTLLATRWRSGARDAAVVAITLPEGKERVIAEPAVFGRAVGAEFVAFVRDGGVYAVRVDGAYAARSAPQRVLPSVLTGATGAAQLAVARDGTLLYVADVEGRSHRAFARAGTGQESADLPVPPRGYESFAVCGGRIAAVVNERGVSDLWIGRLDGVGLTRVTTEGSASEPVWSADCRTLAFGWNITGAANVHTVRVDSGSPPELFARSRFNQMPGSWSADGRWFAYAEQRPDAPYDIWLRDTATGEARRLTETPVHELVPRLSPDGRWIAYESNATGRFEILVQSVARGTPVQVSRNGGTWPAWSPDGRHLFFNDEGTVLRLSVFGQDGSLAPGPPEPVFSHPDLVSFRPLSPDGFVWLRRTAEHLPITRLDVVLGWAAELDRQLQ